MSSSGAASSTSRTVCTVPFGLPCTNVRCCTREFIRWQTEQAMGRREITTAITMLILCVLLASAAFLGWRSLFAPLPGDEDEADAARSCATERLKKGQRLRSSQVRVSVFNGGTEVGLADTTMAALRKRGFRRGDVSNAPIDIAVSRVQVWSTRRVDVTAELVARQFGEQVKVKSRQDDLGPGVDVIVGDDFNRLVPTPTTIRVLKLQKACVTGARS